jgi:hypothetical protein
MMKMVLEAEIPDNVAELLARNCPEEWAAEAMGAGLACFVQDWWPGDAVRLGVGYEEARDAFDVQSVHFESVKPGARMGRALQAAAS